jgi:hypothetical protein
MGTYYRKRSSRVGQIHEMKISENVGPVSIVYREARARWYGHVIRRDRYYADQRYCAMERLEFIWYGKPCRECERSKDVMVWIHNKRYEAEPVRGIPHNLYLAHGKSK